MNIFDRIEEEIQSYQNESRELSDGVDYSEHRLKKRIYIFKNKVFPTGKVNEQGEYQYYYDIIGPRMSAEIKNLRVDSKHFTPFSSKPQLDKPAVAIMSAALDEFMWDNGWSEKLQEDVELFSGDGNIVWKKVGKDWKRYDPLNFYITNTAAETLADTDVIERHELTQSQLRAKTEWDNVEEVIKAGGQKTTKETENSTEKPTTNPVYEIFERNGEITVAEFKQAKGEEFSEDDKKKYMMARVILSGANEGHDEHKHVLFVEEFKDMNDIYVEAHRGPYNGKWWREGMYELLFDHQVRCNEIGNQLARALEWASKTIYRSADLKTFQNILTGIENGRILRSADLQQVQTRSEAVDQLLADWNRNVTEADRISNSFEVVLGGQLKSQTPLGLGKLLDQNANKLFTFLRQKLTIPYKRLFKDNIFPELIKDLKGRDIIRLTGDTDSMEQIREIQAKQWYFQNLIKIGSHSKELAQDIISLKMEELKENDPVLENSKEMWDGLLNRISITVSGENTDQIDKITDIFDALQLEPRPDIRTHLLDQIYAVRGIQIPQEVQQPQPQPQPVQQQAPAQEQVVQQA